MGYFDWPITQNIQNLIHEYPSMDHALKANGITPLNSKTTTSISLLLGHLISLLKILLTTFTNLLRTIAIIFSIDYKKF
jgi:hypothetical protein